MASSARNRRPARVLSRRSVSATVEEFVVERNDGEQWPSWEPGAHIDVHLPDGSTRQYSLCGDPAELSTLRFAVLREPEGRGGSKWMHDEVQAESELSISGPSNHFGLQRAASYRLIAGGVGITPILAMARWLDDEGATWTLDYLGRSRTTMAYLDELERYGDRVRLIVSEEEGRVPAAELVNTDLGGVAVYACGPESLLAELEDIVTARGGLFRAERFAPRALDEEDAVETAFEVELAESGGVVRVDPGETILSAMEAAGYAPPYSCREGTCGTCETRIVDGAAHHRDSILTPEERAANEYMMICVSRAATERLILEL